MTWQLFHLILLFLTAVILSFFVVLVVVVVVLIYIYPQWKGGGGGGEPVCIHHNKLPKKKQSNIMSYYVCRDIETLCRYREWEIVKEKLLETPSVLMHWPKCDLLSTPVHIACVYGNLDMLDFLHGMVLHNSSEWLDLFSWSHGGCTPAHIAAVHAKLDCLVFLTEHSTRGAHVFGMLSDRGYRRGESSR
jgi:hypothetical protein